MASLETPKTAAASATLRAKRSTSTPSPTICAKQCKGFLVSSLELLLVSRVLLACPRQMRHFHDPGQRPNERAERADPSTTRSVPRRVAARSRGMPLVQARPGAQGRGDPKRRLAVGGGQGGAAT